METIKTYIQNLFQNYPNTPQVQKAREELETIMEDKYQELKAAGKSENEAIGIVISEFGNMDELAEELGVNSVSLEKPSSEKPTRSEHFVSLNEAKNFLAAKKQTGTMVAAGVALCILSVFPLVLFDALASNNLMTSTVSNIIGLSALFLLIAAAVALFIASGMKVKKYEAWKEFYIQLDVDTQQYINGLYESYLSKFTFHITLGVVLCILSVLPTIIFDSIFTTPSSEWMVGIATAMLFPIIALAVCNFIVAGTRKGAYELLLNKGDFSKEKKEENKKIGTVAAVYWPLMAIAYLLWSFVGNAWNISWLLWPIAGIAFGVISTILSASSKNTIHA
ncbi:MAG: permease prefix domain 1-containing protein [Lachnospiraceae bacterium]